MSNINTDIHYLSPNRDCIRENGYLDKSSFYKDNLRAIEKGYLKLASSIKRKIDLIQKIFTDTNNMEKKQKAFF